MGPLRFVICSLGAFYPLRLLSAGCNRSIPTVSRESTRQWRVKTLFDNETPPTSLQHLFYQGTRPCRRWQLSEWRTPPA